MLPSILAPYRVIRQDLVLLSIMRHGNKQYDTSTYEQIALKLGCIDLRTARTHVMAMEYKLKTAQIIISEFLSSNYGCLPHITPGTGLIKSTNLFIDKLAQYYTASFGKIFSDDFFKVLPILNHLDHYDNFSTTYGCQSPSFWDTS